MKCNYFYAAIAVSSIALCGCNYNDIQNNMKEENNTEMSEEEILKEKCFPCEGGSVSAYTNEEITEQLSKLGKGWELRTLESSEVKCLYKKYTFYNYVLADDFAHAITPIAENLGHHPELTYSWGYLIAKIWTHAINGLTSFDFTLALRIDECYSKLEQKS